MKLPFALHVEPDCNQDYTGVVRPTHLLVMAALTSGPVGSRFTGRQKALCGHDSPNPVRVTRWSARLAGLRFAFFPRAAKLK